MARRRGSARRRRRGGSGFLYKLLSVFLICGCLVAAITLFFRVDTVIITGEQRYTEAEIRQASGVEDGACAAVVAAVANGMCEKGRDVTVRAAGGDLVVNYTDEKITLTGDAKLVYTGEAEY